MGRSLVYDPEMAASCTARPPACNDHVDSAILWSVRYAIPLTVYGIGCETDPSLMCTRLETGGYARPWGQGTGTVRRIGFLGHSGDTIIYVCVRNAG